MAGAIGVFGLAILVVMLRGDQVKGAARPAQGPRIAFLQGTLVQNLFLVNLDGGTPQQITNTKNGIMDFDLFPDGRIVYAEQNLDGSTNLMLYDPATTQISTLIKCAEATCNQVAASPDGKLIAFDRSDFNIGNGLAPGAPRIWLYDLTKKTVFRLFEDNQKIGYMARWSPDGTKIASFDSDRGGVVIYDFLTKTESVVPAYGGRYGDFSPDSTRILFSRIIGAPDPGKDDSLPLYYSHITIADISKQPYRLRDLIPDTAIDDDTDPIWAPDGKSLYLLRRAAGTTLDQDRQIYQVDTETGEGTPLLIDFVYTHSNLALNPAGDTMLSQRFRMGAAGARPEIWVIDLKTKQPRLVVSNGNLPRWSP